MQTQNSLQTYMLLLRGKGKITQNNKIWEKKRSWINEYS